MTPALFTAFSNLVRQRVGLRFEGEDERRLAQAILHRITATGSTTANSYFQHISVDEAEFHQLVNLLTINETYFFREEAHLRLLTDRLAPRLLSQERGERPVRIFCAGCSTGEEPYSIAMALDQAFGPAAGHLFCLSGGDIDTHALERARTGRYAPFSFRACPDAVREQYFTRDGAGTHVLSPALRARVTFHHINLLAPAYPGTLHGCDVIFFRNVSIYFDEATRQDILTRLATLLNEGGVLLVGAAETLSNDFGVLSLVETDGLFHFVKGGPAKTAHRPSLSLPTPHAATVRLSRPPPPHPHIPPHPALKATPVHAPAMVAPPPPAAVAVAPTKAGPATATAGNDANAGADLAAIQRLMREKAYDQALAHMAAWPPHRPKEPLLYQMRATILLNRKDLTGAEQAAREAQALEPWSASTFLLLGLIARARRDEDAAATCFKQAVYAQPECWQAHYFLADMYRGRGERDAARREYRVVLQQLSAPNRSEDSANDPLFPLAVSLAALRTSCERHLAGLGGKR